MRVDHKHVTMEPRGVATAVVTFIPTQINLNYSREIKCINVKNEENRLTVNIQSSNVDPQHFAYHSFFYNVTAFELGSDAEVDFSHWPTFFAPTPLDSK